MLFSCTVLALHPKINQLRWWFFPQRNVELLDVASIPTFSSLIFLWREYRLANHMPPQVAKSRIAEAYPAQNVKIFTCWIKKQRVKFLVKKPVGGNEGILFIIGNVTVKPLIRTKEIYPRPLNLHRKTYGRPMISHSNLQQEQWFKKKTLPFMNIHVYIYSNKMLLSIQYCEMLYLRNYNDSRTTTSLRYQKLDFEFNY